MIDNPLWSKLRTGEIDANNQSLFLSILIKGLIYNLNDKISVRGKYVPHYILNTGDDIMYLEVKGQDHSIEPLEVSNEDYIYSMVPRCLVQPGSVDILTDQLTSPYTRGAFTFDYDDTLYTFSAEYRRLPIKIGVSLKYVLDSLTDAFQVIQQTFVQHAFISKFNITYLGQTIGVTYKIPDNHEVESMIEFDGVTLEDKNRKISMDLEVETNIPIIDKDTIIPSDAYVKGFVLGIELPGDREVIDIT